MKWMFYGSAFLLLIGCSRESPLAPSSHSPVTSSQLDSNWNWLSYDENSKSSKTWEYSIVSPVGENDSNYLSYECSFDSLDETHSIAGLVIKNKVLCRSKTGKSDTRYFIYKLDSKPSIDYGDNVHLSEYETDNSYTPKSSIPVDIGNLIVERISSDQIRIKWDAPGSIPIYFKSI